MELESYIWGSADRRMGFSNFHWEKMCQKGTLVVLTATLDKSIIIWCLYLWCWKCNPDSKIFLSLSLFCSLSWPRFLGLAVDTAQWDGTQNPPRSCCHHVDRDPRHGGLPFEHWAHWYNQLQTSSRKRMGTAEEQQTMATRPGFQVSISWVLKFSIHLLLLFQAKFRKSLGREIEQLVFSMTE